MGRIKELSRKPARTRKRNPVVYLICEGSETEIRYFKRFRSRGSTTFWKRPAILFWLIQSTLKQFVARKPTSGMPSGLPTSSSTTLFPVALSLQQISASFGIWCAITGNLQTSMLVKRTVLRTALLFPTSNWTTYFRMSLEKLRQQLPPDC